MNFRTPHGPPQDDGMGLVAMISLAVMAVMVWLIWQMFTR